MKTFFITVHYYEQEMTDDELVMIITHQMIDEAEVHKQLRDVMKRHLRHEEGYPSSGDMLDGVFNELAGSLRGIWCYCKTLPPLVIGDPSEQGSITGNLQAVSLENLAHMLVGMNPGDNLYFYEDYDEVTGISGHVFCSTMIKKYESYVIYINCHGGGLPFVFDITTYYQDLCQLKAELNNYLTEMDGYKGHVFVDSGLIDNDDCKD